MSMNTEYALQVLKIQKLKLKDDLSDLNYYKENHGANNEERREQVKQKIASLDFTIEILGKHEVTQ
ncbi:hypothetical protein [Psychrobacillus sp. FSL K6-1267]|uniref:hypothetical protein n=1 Tax=Psychrobacillus sp. FSL K6-1267 TaxID=2921543 RepID=UPI0030F765F9